MKAEPQTEEGVEKRRQFAFPPQQLRCCMEPMLVVCVLSVGLSVCRGGFQTRPYSQTFFQLDSATATLHRTIAAKLLTNYLPIPAIAGIISKKVS